MTLAERVTSETARTLSEIREDMKDRAHMEAMIARPGNVTIERVKSSLHEPNPSPEVGWALRILDLIWIECQKAAGR